MFLWTAKIYTLKRADTLEALVQHISSTKNPHIQMLRSLRDAKGRASADCFLAEGRSLCCEALRDAFVVTLLVDAEKTEAFSDLITKAQDVVTVPAHVLAYVCETKTPQGIVASVRIPAPSVVEGLQGNILVLDGVQDPGNVGTMIRTAEAAGFGGVLMSPACADVFAPKTVRASMGSVLRIPRYRGDLPVAMQKLKQMGYRLISSELGGTLYQHMANTIENPFALIIGSEGKGVSAAISSLADVCVALPMRGCVESLNAAVAAGILMYRLQSL